MTVVSVGSNVTASHWLSYVNRTALTEMFSTKGATLGAGLSMSQSKLGFVGKLRLEVFSAQGHKF